MYELCTLPFETIVDLMESNTLAVSSEFVVYKAVCAYIQANNTLSESEKIRLFETVRFPYMGYKELEEVDKNKEVPRNLLTEALLIRLRKFEGSSKKDSDKDEIENESPKCKRATPRALYATELEYSIDFDNKGVFYYVGTDGYKDHWENPALKCYVTVTCSSLEKGSIEDVVITYRDVAPSDCWTSDIPSSWIAVNLGPKRSLIPKYYTLRHGGSSRADSLRNWTLQASNDAKNWDVLRRHVGDISLNGVYASCSWPIEGVRKAYRHFRVLQTGKNSSNHNFLSLSGFELYGSLYETKNDIKDGYFSP